MATSELEIKKIRVKDRHRKDLGNLDSLAASIQEGGLLHPVVVTTDNRLVAGQRRLEACRKLGMTEIPVRIIDVPSLLVAERDENLLRKELTPSERVALAEEIAAEIAAQTGERRGRPEKMSVGEEDDGENSGQIPGIPQLGQETREVVAERAGFSSETDYRRTKAVAEKGIPELVALMDAGDIRPGPAAAIAELSKKEQTAAVKAIQAGEKPTLPEKPTKEAKVPKNVVDGLGVAVPRKLIRSFTLVADGLADGVKTLEAMIKSINAANAPNEWLQTSETTAALQEASGKLAESIPYAVHPRCGGKGCDSCRGCGWVPEWGYQRLVSEVAWEAEG